MVRTGESGAASRRGMRVFAGVLLCALAVAGCTAGEPDVDEPTVAPPVTTQAVESTDGPDPEYEVAATTQMAWGSRWIDIEVLPLVRTEGALVLTLRFTGDDPAEPQKLSKLWLGSRWSYRGTSFSESGRQFDGVRVVDFEAGLAGATATGRDEQTISSEGDRELQIAMADPGGDALSVYLPGVPLIEDVPVVEGVPPRLPDERDDPLDLAAVEMAHVAPLVATTVDPVGQSRSMETAESEVIAIASDVLFSFDSADLTPDAKEVVARAAASLAGREPGAVSVVGHTDNVDTHEYNQRLSQQRAEAVAAELRNLVDEADYPLDVSGRGETEPVAPNDTDEERAVNRRVELRIDTPVSTGRASAAGELPPFEGDVATGADGITTPEAPRNVNLRAPSARVVDDHLVVRFEYLPLDDIVPPQGMGSIFWSPLDAVGGQRFYYQTSGTVALAVGDQLVLPVGATVNVDELVMPLADVNPSVLVALGPHPKPFVFENVYPKGIPVGETVTVQRAEPIQRQGFGPPWRLTDIPVAR